MDTVGKLSHLKTILTSVDPLKELDLTEVLSRDSTCIVCGLTHFKHPETKEKILYHGPSGSTEVSAISSFFGLPKKDAQKLQGIKTQKQGIKVIDSLLVKYN